MSSDKKAVDVFDEICDFKIPAYEEWKQAVEKSLKGASFTKLLTSTYEGITLQPMYQKKDIENLAFVSSHPGEFPFVRGTTHQKEQWLVAQEVNHPLVNEANKWLKQDIEKGVNAINVVLAEDSQKGLNKANETKMGTAISKLEDMEVLLEDISLDLPFMTHTGASAVPFVSMLGGYCLKKHLPLTTIKGCIGADPLAKLVKNGELVGSMEEYIDEMSSLLSWVKENELSLETIFIEGHPYHDGGANGVQELAFMLATSVYYVRELQNRGHSIDDIVSSIRFSMSIGSNLFMELAKVRATRMLWTKIVTAFGGNEEACKLKIHARTSNWTKTAYDPHVNILRGTVEAFTAAVSGINSLHVSPFDEVVSLPNQFSRRVARNIQLVLQEETQITNTVDPSGGSWYVEKITDEIAEGSWKLFQQIEAQGGMFQALQDGIPQKLVNEISKQKKKDIEKRKLVFVGSTMYPNKDESLIKGSSEEQKLPARDDCHKLNEQNKENLSLRKSHLVQDIMTAFINEATMDDVNGARFQGAVLSVEPIISYRGAEDFEALRLFSEKQKAVGKPFNVYVTNLGTLPEHKARTDFIASFFETGGFDIEKSHSFTSLEDAIDSSIKTSANVVVLCGKNESYKEAAVQIVKEVKEKRNNLKIFIAGKQEQELEKQLLEVGADGFIHVGTNCYQLLKELQEIEGGINDE